MEDKRILVIEDDPVVCRDITIFLGKLGAIVRVELDPADALSVLRTHEFDLIIVDLVLPGMTGLDLLTEAKHFGWLKCPVVVMTAYREDWVSDKSNVAGILVKPFTGIELIDAINKVFDKQ